MYDGPIECRDVFALGGVIVKANHLKTVPSPRDYSLSDANDAAAMDLARGVLAQVGVQVPVVYFAGKVSALPERVHCGQTDTVP